MTIFLTVCGPRNQTTIKSFWKYILISLVIFKVTKLLCSAIKKSWTEGLQKYRMPKLVLNLMLNIILKLVLCCVQQMLVCESISTFNVHVEYLKTIDSGSCNYVSSGENTHRCCGFVSSQLLDIAERSAIAVKIRRRSVFLVHTADRLFATESKQTNRRTVG